MEERKIVVVVEETEAARTALKWALHNILRYGDVLTLVHIYSSKSRTKKKLRLLRLKGYQLALSFQHICSSSSFNTKIEIVVAEDDSDGEKIVGLVREIGAFAMVLGLHDHSFIYRLALRKNSNITKIFNCKVLAIKQPRNSSHSITTSTKLSSSSPSSLQEDQTNLPNLDFSQIDIAPLQFPEIVPAKIRYQVCPSTQGIIWRSKKTRRRQKST